MPASVFQTPTSGRPSLGHASAKVTLDTYSHLWPDDEDRTRAVLEDSLRAVVSHSCHDDGAEMRNRWSER
jgi:hypothetical protein